MARLKPVAVLLLLLLVAAWIINQYIVVKSRAAIFRPDGPIPEVEAVIVPGASVYRSGKLSPVLRQRMETALGFLGRRPGARLVLSGFAIPGGYNEAQAMADYARRASVPDSQIVVDEKGRSTYVTLLNVRRLGLRRVLVVSQDYHLPRALYIANRMGMEASGLAVAEGSPDGRFHLREYTGRVKDFLLIRVSKYLHAD
jgi:SanA protein